MQKHENKVSFTQFSEKIFFSACTLQLALREKIQKKEAIPVLGLFQQNFFLFRANFRADKIRMPKRHAKEMKLETP